MSDIINVLESAAGGNDAHVCALAKADIQRYLRCARSGDMIPDGFGAWCKYDEAAAEIERLRDKLVEYMNETQTKAAEIERLREELEKLHSAYTFERNHATLKFRAEKEVERLRGLLRECLPHFERGQPILWKRVREALGE